MQEFKLNDKVTIGPNSIGVGVGTVFTVVENLRVKGVWIDVRDKEVMLKYVHKGLQNCFADFTLYVEDKPKRFAVGDRVISTRDTPEVPEGFVGYIVDKPSNSATEYDYAVQGIINTEYFNEDELELLSMSKETPVKDVINSPKHYAVFEDVEAIQVIASCMTQEMFKGYCLGNILKYRLRAGAKDDVMQELGKADKYQELFSQHKHLCKE
jgi:hypothetical protein